MKQLESIMWSLQNFARMKVLPNEGQGADKVRFMLKTALRVNKLQVMHDTLMAFQEVLTAFDDNQKRQMFDTDTVERILFLIQSLAPEA